MDDIYSKNVQAIKNVFKKNVDKENKYLTIIEFGKTLPKFPDILKTKENQVNGCQSITYIASSFKNNILVFIATSDALISKGLAAILIKAYENTSPSVLLNTPPTFFKEINIQESLSPARANGLFSMYEKMKKEAKKYLKN